MPTKKSKSRKPRAGSTVKSVRSIDPVTRVLLATAAGGRCEFGGCNEYLFEHPLTLKDGNFSEIAHVVAFSEDGPRGKQGARPKNINAIENLMLLCRKDHKQIDSDPDDFPRELLEKFKSDHEARIRHVTGLGPDMRTTVVQFKALIGGSAVEIPATQIYQAVAPRWPTDKRGCVIDLTSVSTDDDAFMATAMGTIRKKVQTLYEAGMDVEETRHVSLFALGPIPLLVFLGLELSNKITVDLFQRHRDNDEPTPWQWREDGAPARYSARLLRRGSSTTEAVLVVSLSGTIDRSQLPAFKNVSIYEIKLTSADPNVHFLRQRGDLEAFRKTYRNLLARITRVHPRIRDLHLFPAVPAPVGVALGHDLLPKVHPTLLVYDRDKFKGGFTLRLKVNEHDQHRIPRENP